MTTVAVERLAQVPGELADRGRLAGAVDADDEDHGRVGPQVDLVVAGAGELRRAARRAGRSAPRRRPARPPRPRARAPRRPARSSGRRRRRRSAPPRGAPTSPRRGRPRTASPGPRRRAPRASCACSRAGGGRSPRRSSSRSGSAGAAAGAPWSRTKRSYQSLAMAVRQDSGPSGILEWAMSASPKPANRSTLLGIPAADAAASGRVRQRREARDDGGALARSRGARRELAQYGAGLLGRGRSCCSPSGGCRARTRRTRRASSPRRQDAASASR